MKKTKQLFIASMLAATPATAQQAQEIFNYQSAPVGVSVLPEMQQNRQVNTLIGATSGMLEKYAPGGIIPSAVNAFLVYRYGQLTLIDAGFGAQLFECLQSLGFTADDVSVVLLTHLHGDHIGGLLRNGKPAFPNATVYLAQQEYDYWTSDEEMNKLPENRRSGFENARKTLEAYSDRFFLFEPAKIGDAEQREVIPGIYGIAAFGHTPGHTMYKVTLPTEQLLIWADLTHATAVQLPHPEVAVTYDVHPGQAVDSRREVLRYAAKNSWTVAGSHIAFPGMGWVFENKQGGYIFQPALTPEAVRNAVNEQLEKYPASRLQDIYKNFFQDYFGPGHMIPDAAAAKNYLQQELDSLTGTSGAIVEPTGSEGRFYRVSLSAVKENKAPAGLFLEAFLESANDITVPPSAVWTAQWKNIVRIIDDMPLRLPDYEADKAKLDALLSEGKFAVHHSPAYEELYKPHYRIISKSVFEKKLKALL
ncbi:MAG: MBL fold metallo-hydrolase [Prevotellaceae bacterium]|jgi:glyoxylase-like metal-dependent hydrolase (beta-lactamase superfamily II)|nr:MBL fold metallo-hydrolase [Prevotellaceae bacterium]